MVELPAQAAPEMPTLAGDDPGFIELVHRAVSWEVSEEAVQRLFVIRIDNWFDHKWRNFSGKGRVTFGHYTGLKAYNPETVLDVFRHDGSQTTLPPFTPNRVVSQNSYGQDGEGTFVLNEDAPSVHHAKKEHSSSNLQQRIATRNHSSLFVWFSSKTAINRRGSLMVYRADGGNVTTWYASLALGDDWRVARTEGITQQELVRMFKP